MKKWKLLALLYLLTATFSFLILYSVYTPKHRFPKVIKIPEIELEDLFSLEHYVDLPRGFCSQSSLVFVTVQSKPSNFENRRLIRETWKNVRANIFFVIGRSHNATLEEKLNTERKKHRDIIRIDISNSVLVSLVLLKVASMCTKINYFLKTNDDTLIDVSIMELMLIEERLPENLLTGHAACTASHQNKGYIPRSVYPFDSYPKYLSGKGYLMSSEVAARLWKEAVTTITEGSDQHIFDYEEDVFITGVLAKRAGVALLDNPSFLPKEHYVGLKCLPGFIVAIFDVGLEEYSRLHAILENDVGKMLCREEVALPFSTFWWLMDNVFLRHFFAGLNDC